MVPEWQIFNISGPTYLKSVNWNNANHRRCVMASLVQGVYVHEHDRRMNRTGPKSVASPWWEFFDFRLIETLHDSFDNSVIGAVLHLKAKSGKVNMNSPKYVIAFRGIITSTPAPPLYKDFLLCIRSYFGILQNSTRFQRALGRVQHWVTVAGGGAPNVWLTGHSLGSAMALLAAKSMAMSGRRLPTYLFNPPFPSAMLERTNNQKLGQGIHIASSVVKAGVSIYLRSQKKKKKKKKNLQEGSEEEDDEEEEFCALRDWVPCMFLNPGDPICSGYIGYFEQRLKMKEVGGEAVEEIATKHTVKSLIMCNVLNINSEARHLLPSTELIITQAQSPCFRVAHGIKQWWDPTLPSHHVICRYKSS